MAFGTKIYVVLQRMNVPTPQGDNVRVVGAYLTSRKAQGHIDKVPGTFLHKDFATK